jgi:hypothetical protein
MRVETVLGLSVTATHVQTVLVEGRDASGATLEHNDFEVFTPDVSMAHASDQVARAVHSIATADGHQLRAIAVTWSEDADLEAALVLDALAEAGFGQTVPVVAVGARHAAEALAHSIGEVVDFRRTAVCVVEPESVLLSLIDTTTGSVATRSTRAVRSVDALTEWVDWVFVGEDWYPDGVFLVGAIGGLSVLADRLSEAVGVPVFDPPGAELALAHGAALASGTEAVQPTPAAPAPRRNAALPVTMMTAGAAAIVVSTALLVSPALLPDRPPPPVAQAVARVVPPPPADPAPSAALPVPVSAPVEPAEELVPEPLVVDVPAEAPAPAQDAQFVVEAVPAAPAPEAAPVLPPADIPAPAPAFVPPAPAVVPLVPQVPDVQPRLRDRIRDRLNRIGLGN